MQNTSNADQNRKDAPLVVATHLAAARREIDAQFGDGYAEANPALVAAFIQACATYTATTTAGQLVDEGLRIVADALNGVASAMAAD